MERPDFRPNADRAKVLSVSMPRHHFQSVKLTILINCFKENKYHVFFDEVFVVVGHLGFSFLLKT